MGGEKTNNLYCKCSETNQKRTTERNKYSLTLFNARKILTVRSFALWVDGVSINYVVLVTFSVTPTRRLVCVCVWYSFFFSRKNKKKKLFLLPSTCTRRRRSDDIYKVSPFILLCSFVLLSYLLIWFSFSVSLVGFHGEMWICVAFYMFFMAFSWTSKLMLMGNFLLFDAWNW